MTSRHVLYTHDNQSRYRRESIRRSSSVEVLWQGEWIGGYEVRTRYTSFVAVIDKADGFFGELFDVPLSHVRAQELAEPIWRDSEGNIGRIGPRISRPLSWT